MKKYILCGIYFAMAVALKAQVIVGNYGIQYVYSAPSGSCSANTPMQVVVGSGTLYTCQNGTWAQITGGGSSVSLTATAPIVITPSPTTGTGVISAPTAAVLNATNTFSAAGAASSSAMTFTGNPFTGGTGTTTIPLVYFNGGTAPTTWSTSGTYLGFNAVSGFAGNFIEAHNNGGALLFSFSSTGTMFLLSSFSTGNSVFANAGAVSAKGFSTASNCAATGTAASPSVAACSSAAAGAFSCATNASGATCTINTTAVTANSEINVWPVADESTRLGVTCNTGPTTPPAIILASKTASTGFTINLPTFSANPVCYDYTIIN